jgi:two-component system chemotaxis response regulator CheY
VKVLVVDDDRMSRRIVGRFLEFLGYEIVEAEDGAEAFDIARRQRIRLIITDWMMPKMDGPELVQRLRKLADGHRFYVILLTSKDQQEELVEAMDAGADDFIRKPFEQGELRTRVRAGKRIIELTEKLERQAMTDPLTGLLNRRGLHDAVGAEDPQRDCQGGRGLGFIVADLDHFKRINDTHGHAAGDLILLETARRLRAVFEPQGLVARMGGEEFWVLLCDCDREGLLKSAEAARQRIATEPFPLAGDSADDAAEPVSLTASFGCTHIAMLGTERLEHLFQIADTALYRAKAEGRNRVCAA